MSPWLIGSGIGALVLGSGLLYVRRHRGQRAAESEQRRLDQKRDERLDERLDEALRESFPASDPPAVSRRRA